MLERLTRISMRYPWATIGVILAVTAVFALQFPKMTIDTDPENMLQPDQPDRAFYDAIKEEFDIDDIIVVGIVDPKGFFRPEALREIRNIIDQIKNISWHKDEIPAGLEAELVEIVNGRNGSAGGTLIDAAASEHIDLITKTDIVSITTTKNIYSQAGAVKPDFIMVEDFFDEPQSEAEFARQVNEYRDFIEEQSLTEPTTFDELIEIKISKMEFDIKDTPFLNERVASSDGDAIAIYIPIISKKVGYHVAGEVTKIMNENLLEGQEFHVAGLPIAEETFGVEMFMQMAVVAPLAFLLIMLIVYLLFRQPLFLIPVGVTAALSVTWAMGLLIGLDFTVHIMSSMIPVFLLPIAILNSVHILSQFFDRFCITGKKEESLLWAMRRLYMPMFFTSLTSAVGFASLAMADIPPVQVFGLFVAFGIGVAWFFSLTLVPAMVNLLNEEKLACALHRKEEERKSLLDTVLKPIEAISFKGAPAVLALSAVALVVGVLGIMRINVNDNPVKWFKEGHPIRVADTVLNEKFGGTYMTNLIIEGAEVPAQDDEYIKMLEAGEFPNILNNPEVADYISRLQAYLERTETVGKASSIYDAAKRVRYVLVGEADESLDREERKEQYYAIGLPSDFNRDDLARKEIFEREYLDNLSDDEYDEFFDTYDYIEDSPEFRSFKVSEDELNAVLSRIAFQDINFNIAQLDNDQHTQRDMVKFLATSERVLDDYSGGSIQKVWEKANIWIQLKQGDNQKMQEVMDQLDSFIAENPLPEGLAIKWTGLTYINKVWQDLMVNGMLFAIIGSFGIVFLLMLIEFRSLTLGIMAMVPLTLALLLSYGLMGWLGKDYDMPIAVCSSLSLGLAVDFAIHFLQRYKNHYKQTGELQETHDHMFQEPGRAILRNAIVISLGFLPLMVSSLTPYVTVGSFFSLLMVMSTLATIFVLPAAMRYLAPRVFKTGAKA